MKHLHLRRPSPAMGVALLALFVALGGTGYAAVKLGKNTVGSKQIKSGAVRSAEVKNRSLLKKDFKAGQLPAGPRGPQGVQGGQGLQGERGPAGADATNLWAVVTADPRTLVRGSGVTSVATGTATGTTKLTFDRDVSKCAYVASPGNDLSFWSGGATPSRQQDSDPKVLQVLTYDDSGNPVGNRPFYLAVFC
jgi:hypothetical protein